MKYRAREQMHSERIGFRLYAIAEDPIWVDSNGSSTFCAVTRHSIYLKLNKKAGEGVRMCVRYLEMGKESQVCRDLCAVAPNDASGVRMSMSILHEYVCDVTGYA